MDPTSPPQTGSEAFERTVVNFTHPGDAELHDHQDAQLQIGFDPQDQMPKILSGSFEGSLAPTLDPETLLCMEDSSSYVLRDAGGNVMARFAPDEVDRTGSVPTVSRISALSHLAPRYPVPRFRDTRRLRLAVGALLDGPTVRVEPVRPQCRHYARQIIDFPGEAGHIMMRRFCRANRTDDGEYESVREALVFACELRDPRDSSSEDQIHKFDDDRVRAGRQRNKEHTFDVAAELRRAEGQPKPPLADKDPELADPRGGIFNPR